MKIQVRWLSAAVVAGFLVSQGVASATTITFESAPAGTFPSYSESGATFTAFGGGGLLSAISSPNGTRALLDNNSPRKTLRADISGGTNFVSVDLGDFDADADTLFLNIFDSSNVLLGSTSQFIDASFTGMVTLSLSAPNIAYAQFGATAPAVNGSSVFADNFTFSAAAPVPEPASLLLLGSGGLALLRWRRRSER